MKNPVTYEITKHLETKDGFQFGGRIARAVHDLTGAKESVVERIMREMAEDGLLERVYEQVDGRGPRVVLYRLPVKTTLFE